MIAKIYKYGIALVLTTLCLSSCQSDLLDTTPYDKISSTNMWTTESLVDQGITGVYSTLAFPSPIGARVWWFESFSITTQKRDPQSVTLGTLKSNNAISSERWRYCYNMIHRANDAIKNLQEVAPLTATKKSRLIGECKFLRAYAYYSLNETFRGVPVYLEPVEIANATKGRETEAEVWKVIVEDLTDCINNPDLPNKYSKGDANFGRATKAAAYALRGKAYMWIKEYAKAEADFRMVGTLGHSLLPTDYKLLFKESNEQSDEMIFSVQCVSVTDLGNDAEKFVGTRVSYQSGWNHFLPSPDFVDTYECKDGKPFNWDDFIPGYNSLTPKQRKVFFLRNNLTDTEKNKFQVLGAAMEYYLPNGNEERIKKVFEDRDPRLMATIITPYSTYYGTRDNVNAFTYTLRWPYRNFASPTFDVITDTNTKFYYLYRKFVAEGVNEIINRDYAPNDIPLIRYADVLLLLAEAINEQGFDPEAISIVNQVRGRSGCALLQNTDASLPTYVSGQENLRQRIRNERRWELNLEGVTLFDEYRWGTWKETKFASGSGEKQIWGELDGAPFYWPGDYYNKWPIPRTEVEMNSNIKQNEGWVD